MFDADRQETYVLIPAADFRSMSHLTSGAGDEWTDEKNTRRCELIDRELAGTLSADERAELLVLQQQPNAHSDRVAPPPMDGALQLYQRLLAKRDGST